MILPHVKMFVKIKRKRKWCEKRRTRSFKGFNVHVFSSFDSKFHFSLGKKGLCEREDVWCHSPNLQSSSLLQTLFRLCERESCVMLFTVATTVGRHRCNRRFYRCNCHLFCCNRHFEAQLKYQTTIDVGFLGSCRSFRVLLCYCLVILTSFKFFSFFCYHFGVVLLLGVTNSKL